MSRKYGEELDEDDYLDTRRQTAFTKLGKKVVSSRSREWNHGSDSEEDSREHILPSMNRRRDDEDDEGERGAREGAAEEEERRREEGVVEGEAADAQEHRDAQ